MHWWESGVGENAFMEVTRRDDIGVDLKAPLGGARRRRGNARLLVGFPRAPW